MFVSSLQHTKKTTSFHYQVCYTLLFTVHYRKIITTKSKFSFVRYAFHEAKDNVTTLNIYPKLGQNRN